MVTAADGTLVPSRSWRHAELLSSPQHSGVAGTQKILGYPSDTVRVAPACPYSSTIVTLECPEILAPGITTRQYTAVRSVPGNHPDLLVSIGRTGLYPIPRWPSGSGT